MAHASMRPQTRQDLAPSRTGDGRSTEESKQLVLPKYRPFDRCRDLANYQRLDKVGQGTFGEVFKARSKDPPYEIVALKKVLMKNESEGFPITALREIKILMLMRHPNVLTLFEIVQTPATEFNRQTGSIYLVFEYMDHDLGGLLNRGVEFTAPEVMCISRQILEGTHYVHTQKILHRDMKVANILMSNRGIVKIADFGLARGEAKNSRYTALVCTRWYRPPELLLGERNYTTAIDIWGIGCIAAELFVGRPILQGGRPDARDESENDLDQFLKICELCGTPSEANWEGYDKLPLGRFVMPTVAYHRTLESYFQNKVRGTKSAIPFIGSMLTLDPKKRPSASEALNDNFFWGGDIVDGKESDPLPCKPEEIRQFQSSHEFAVQRRNPMKPAGVKAVRADAAPAHRHPPADPTQPRGVHGAPPMHGAPPPRDRGHAAPSKHYPSVHQSNAHHPTQPQHHGGKKHHHPAGTKPHAPGGQPGPPSYAKTAHRGSSTAGRGGHRGEAHPHGGHTHLSGTTHAVSHAHASGGGGSHASNAYTTPQKPVQTQGSPHSGTAQPHTQRNRPSVWASSTSQSASQARHHQQQPPPHDSRRFNPSQHNPRGHSSRHGQHQGRPLTGHARSGRTPTQHPHHYSPSAYRNKGHSPMPGGEQTADRPWSSGGPNDGHGVAPRGGAVSGDNRNTAHHSGNADSAKRYRSGEDYGYSGHESASKRLNVGAGAHGGSSAGGASGDYH